MGKHAARGPLLASLTRERVWSPVGWHAGRRVTLVLALLAALLVAILPAVSLHRSDLRTALSGTRTPLRAGPSWPGMRTKRSKRPRKGR